MFVQVIDTSQDFERGVYKLEITPEGSKLDFLLSGKVDFGPALRLISAQKEVDGRIILVIEVIEPVSLQNLFGFLALGSLFGTSARRIVVYAKIKIEYFVFGFLALSLAVYLLFRFAK